MRKIIIILCLFFASIFSYGQPKEYIRNDSLIIKIKRNFYLNGSTEMLTRNVNTKINFDFKDQYPFYYLNNRQLGKNNKVFIEYPNLPHSGYVYFFTKNKHGRFNNINITNCNDFSKSNSFFVNIIQEEIEYLSFWYAKEKIEDLNTELGKLHYTIGNFLHRTTNYLHNSLNLPKQDWNFLEKDIGIEFDSTSNNKLITPIIIKIK